MEFHNIPINSENISLGVFLLLSLILLFYYWFYYSRIAFFRLKQIDKPKNQPPVSVIICAKNEYENLKDHLPSILEQDYPSYEVVLVNDFSEDESFSLLRELEKKHAHFKVVNLRENVNFFSGKKLALAVGIKSAKNEIVLLTDADCKPASSNWLSAMSRHFTEKSGIEVVLGFGSYAKRKGFLNALIRYDATKIALQYMSLALAGRPYMGVGRNLSYTKSLFFRIGGFASHYKLKSGDDDLFVNKASGKTNTRVEMHPDSFTVSKPKLSFTGWFRQKKRHLSSSGHYKFGDKFRLGLYGISHSLFYVSFVIFLLFQQNILPLWIALGVLFVKTASQQIIFYYAGKRYKETKLFLYSPLLDIVFAILNPIFAVSNIFYRKNSWK